MCKTKSYLTAKKTCANTCEIILLSLISFCRRAFTLGNLNSMALAIIGQGNKTKMQRGIFYSGRG